ncbi:NADPH-dependent oxidoreductase [Treponema phagedenis]|uniref:Putative NADPH-flavin oxidoreductase n=1 Tax=Treponema phagedenis TaxID=162 RepID=A0A0B7H1G2_TREPH|nr:nitroreductase family protein [Treponema phagedenis]QEJ93945.1 NADPH-dependent oxidoreductase [Treponema phagedenis]QEK07160.1 NADPH-dependent oxidoreductase [Treponema phagedenis]QSH98881.1 NADPH-dependent oxidoreductase [Treponema phagedenis]CEM62806.1 putative NADPH-flavin oxidoreductase [Treponema phagedenis]
MNEVIKLLQTHSSIRKFDASYVIPEKDLQEIIKASKQAPSWMNGQPYSIIVFNDAKIKEDFAVNVVGAHDKAAKNMNSIKACSVFLLYCIDFYKFTVCGDFSLSDSAEPLMIASVDIGLAMQNAAVAAESLRLGCVCIGGIRNQQAHIIEALKLPKFVYPLVGLAIGKPDENTQVKPRLPDSVNVFYNRYDAAQVQEKDLQAYNQTMKDFAVQSGYTTEDWINKFLEFYTKPHYAKNTDEMLAKHGLIKKN